MNSYEVIGKKLLSLMENSKDEWIKTWSCPKIGSLENYVTHHKYTRGNVFLLQFYTWLKHFPVNQFLTYKQCTELGEHVLEGESGVPVLYWNETEKKDEAGNVIKDEAGNSEKYGYIRYYTVFNVWQTSLKEKIKLDIVSHSNNVIENCEKIIGEFKTKPNIRTGDEIFEACYSPTTDEVRLPSIHLFTSSEEFYATMFHELIHSTAHKSRLNRILDDKKIENGVEELVAEIGAVLLNNEAGISTIKNNVAYMNHWMKAIDNNAKSFLYACGKAVDAVQYILNQKEGR